MTTLNISWTDTAGLDTLADLMDPARITRATLTTDHAASSHGLPVVVLTDGTALGIAEVPAFGVDVDGDLDAAGEALVAAARGVGYVVMAR